MTEHLDEKLRKFFTPEKIQEAFRKYEESKQDFFDAQVNIQIGADGISYDTFKEELGLRSLYISKRVLDSNTYQFYPFREVNILKPSGGERVLSIATIRDVLVQKLLYEALYDEVEKKFRHSSKLNQVSCAYRKGKSAPRAATLIHRYVRQGFRFALDADIVKFFDEIPHDKLIALIEKHFGQTTLASKLLRRFIKTGGIPYRAQNNKIKAINFHHYKPNRQKIRRKKGIPQGGVLSGMLANLYLHDFDCWIVEDLSLRFELRYIRYADDFVVLAKQETDLPLIHQEILEQLQKIDLRLHDLGEKTKYVDVLKDKLKFVGFSFNGEHIKVHEDNIRKFQARITSKLLPSKEDHSSSKVEADYNFGRSSRKRFKFFINRVINRKIVGRDDICQTCSGLTEERVRNWVGFFSACTDSQQFHELDKWIRKEIGRYFWQKYRIHLKRADFREAGLRSLEQEYYRIRQKQFCRCHTYDEMTDTSEE